MAARIVSRSDFFLCVFLLPSHSFLSALGQNAQIAGTITDPSRAWATSNSDHGATVEVTLPSQLKAA